MIRRPLLLVSAALVLPLAACDPPSAAPPAQPAPTAPAAPSAPPVAPAEDPNGPLTPPEPGQPGGLPDDRTPLDESPFKPESAQGAGTVVETYFGLLHEGRFEEAYRLWGNGGEASDMTLDQFKASFAAYQNIQANVGKPGDIEGAAGSLYIEVPAQVYGRLKTGPQYNLLGKVTLRRVNDVPGSTAEQRKWHIVKVEVAQIP